MFPSLTCCQRCFLCWFHSPSDCVHSTIPALHRWQSFRSYKESKLCALTSRSIFDKGLWLDALGCTHTLVHGGRNLSKGKYPVSRRRSRGCLQDRNNRYPPQLCFFIGKKGQQAPGGISVGLSYWEVNKRIIKLWSDFSYLLLGSDALICLPKGSS